MGQTDEQAMIHRNGRLAANIRAGLSPLTPEIIETIRANAKAGIDIPGPRALQLLDELAQLRALLVDLDSALARARRAEIRAGRLHDLATNALGREPDELDLGEED